MVGKRKASIARIWVWAISGDKKSVVSVNNRNCLSYFNNSPKALLDITRPFTVIDEDLSDYCVVCKVKGGGISAQSEAVRLGISKCLLALLPHMRPALKKDKLLRRDSRIVEPKKTGLRGARKREQFSKR
ncbi:MAG: 30S ribosomal protein S9 [Alphaproteobacteria bacterium]|nr:30S ribosomal protein S9 [Rickettsiales bacterium]